MFDDIIRKLGHLPEGVRRVQFRLGACNFASARAFRLGEDWEGAPAVWITFVTSDDLKPLKAKIADLQCISGEVAVGNPPQRQRATPLYIEIAG